MRKIEIEEYRQILVGVLSTIDRLCNEHHLRYFLCYGTLLGAVRHQGFIPWDDDIDIVMPRDDYNKLAEVICAGHYGINFIRIETNKDTIFPYGKVCDVRTHVKQKNFREVEGYGAFVDVFPCDYLEEEDNKRLKEGKKLLNLFKVAEHSSRVRFNKTDSFITNFKRTFAFVASRPISTRRVIEKINQRCQKNNKTPNGKLGVVMWGDKLVFTEDDFSCPSEVLFEGKSFRGPQYPEELLEKRYGDWKKLPQVEEQVLANHSLTCYFTEDEKKEVNRDE